MTAPLLVPSFDVRRVNAPYEQAFASALLATLGSGQLILGDEVNRFEGEFARYCGTQHCIGVGNGLDALTLALLALGIGPGDEVIVPAFTFIATWFSVSQTGAAPVPVDVREDGTLDPAKLRAAMTAKTRAIVPVHLFGRLADIDAITTAAEGVPIVEDAAQAHGARRHGRSAGSFGTLAAFSFYPTKNLGALGDGGAVTCSDPALAARVRALSNYGSARKYHHDHLGLNSRLDSLQAHFLSIKLPDLEAGNRRRRAIVERYRQELGTVRGLTFPLPAEEDMVWHQVVVQSTKRDQLQAALLERGIGTTIHYPVAPFDQPCYAGRYDASRYPIASHLARSVLSLPLGPYLTDQDVTQVIDAFDGVG